MRYCINIRVERPTLRLDERYCRYGILICGPGMIELALLPPSDRYDKPFWGYTHSKDGWMAHKFGLGRLGWIGWSRR